MKFSKKIYFFICKRDVCDVSRININPKLMDQEDSTQNSVITKQWIKFMVSTYYFIIRYNTEEVGNLPILYYIHNGRLMRNGLKLYVN